jgi:hypothetical protein
MSKLQTAAEKASEHPPEPSPAPNPFAGLPQALAKAISDLKESQIRNQNRLAYAVDAACRPAYATAPQDVRLPSYCIQGIPAALLGELEGLHKGWQAVVADCTAHD